MNADSENSLQRPQAVLQRVNPPTGRINPEEEPLEVGIPNSRLSSLFGGRRKGVTVRLVIRALRLSILVAPRMPPLVSEGSESDTE